MANLTEEQTLHFREAFALFAKDGKTISAKDLGSVMQAVGQTPAEDLLVSMIKAVDTTGKGSVDINEFLAMMAAHPTGAEAEEELKEAFRVFDQNSTGFITPADFHHVMTNFLHEKVSLEEVEEMVHDCDVDGDGRINYEEFVKMMLPKH
ncbi:calmodulin [Chytriomyces sp. MP71]|nr:calmodulin [Chytriomyces sp. MP71]